MDFKINKDALSTTISIFTIGIVASFIGDYLYNVYLQKRRRKLMMGEILAGV